MFYRMFQTAMGAFVVMSPHPLYAADALATYEIARTEAQQTVTIDGRIEAETQANIAAQTGGRILERLVEAGDWVQKGQLLLRIDDREAQHISTVATAQLRAAQAELAHATLEKDRNAAMLQRKLIGQAAFDQAHTRYRSALAAVNALTASAQLSQTQASFTKVLAPFSGWVAEISANVGDLALPGKPLLTLYAPSKFRVVAPLSLHLLALWQRDQEAHITLADGSPLNAASVTLQPHTDAIAQQVKLRFDLTETKHQLIPGAFAKVKLTVSSEKKILVPKESIIRRGELTAVYVIEDGHRVQLRQVRVGKSYGDLIEVLAGLSPGEHISTDTNRATLLRGQQTPSSKQP